MGDFKRNHYVPQWHQRRFFPEGREDHSFHYLDLKPDMIVSQGRQFREKSLLRRGPLRCFREDDLYTTRFGSWQSTEIERRFFGKIDTEGKQAVEYISSFAHPSVNNPAFRSLLTYLSAQKLRTPKGLAWLSGLTSQTEPNWILVEMQKLRDIFCALWTECVWSIASAAASPTKFILTDHPVTAYNPGCFPDSQYCRGCRDPEPWLTGTHTLFPLGIDKLLVLTNLSWVRNPYGNPTRKRPNPNPFRDAMFDFRNIQTGRELSETEVREVNFILKRRAYQYVAAAEAAWLYPEEHIPTQRWDRLGDGYLLMPDPRAVSFATEVIVGYTGGRTESLDEYGRRPWQKGYSGGGVRDDEWQTFQAFQGEFARVFGPRRRGRTFAFDRLDEEVDNPEHHKYHLNLEGRNKSGISMHGVARQRGELRRRARQQPGIAKKAG